MQKIIPFLFFLTLMANLNAQTFHHFLNRINTVPDSAKAALVDSFMSAVPGFPFIEQDTLVHYLFRGNATTVTVPGDANNWNPAAFSMSRISGTDLWYHTHVFEPDARLDYKFVLNGGSWILDPLNPFQVTGGFGPNSELRMPLYIPAPEIEYYPAIPHGTLFDTTFFSAALGNSRQVSVYLPPQYYSSSDSFAVVLFHDGLEYISLANANNVLDYLIWKQRIRPLIAVFIPPVNRTGEYAGSLKQPFTDFVISDIFGWLDTKYRTHRRPEQRAVLGASNGGNIALWMGLTHPEIFGNIAAQSSNVQSSISSGFRYGSQLALKFYLDIGTYDIPVLIPLVQNLVQILNSRGYEYRYRVYHEGHSWGNWRAHIDNALEMFFPGPVYRESGERPVADMFSLQQNFPNPFNGTTVIPYRIKKAGSATLRIYNVTGQLVRVLVQENQAPGEYTVSWDGRDSKGRMLPSGIFFFRFDQGEVRKMLLIK
ncbi:MAG TPA: T9SS type A sorting domain-containing protein [Caldithrix sp.]|nr:T9SS type A sorting domain-containing protein [Caldithrix sp.]